MQGTHELSGLKPWLHNNVAFGSPASVDAADAAFIKFKEEVRSSGLDAAQKIDIEFGRKVGGAAGQGHALVVLRVSSDPVTLFKIELQKDMANGDEKYVRGHFRCPKETCHLETDSFTDLSNHHLENHRDADGDEVIHSCCGEDFGIFETFCAHVYDKHRSFKAVTLNGEWITEAGIHKFSEPNITFFPHHRKHLSLEEAFLIARDIILNFDTYWIFCWHCQDFVTWFLLNVGIPLQMINPTFTDKLTGTGTGRSAVQQSKKWSWYKEPEQLKHYGLSKWLTSDSLVRCAQCDHLPPMNIHAMERHQDIAHSGDKGNSDVELRQTCLHTFCGTNEGLNLDPKTIRRYSIYTWKSSPLGHESLVCQPWTEGRIVEQDDGSRKIEENEHPLDFFHTTELRVRGDKSNKMNVHCEVIPKPQKIDLLTTARMSVTDLTTVVVNVFKSHGSYSVEERNCRMFCNQLLSGLLFYIDSDSLQAGEFQHKILPIQKPPIFLSMMNTIAAAYPRFRSLGNLHPLLIVLHHCISSGKLFDLVTSVWVSLYAVFRIVDIWRPVLRLGHIAFLRHDVPDHLRRQFGFKFLLHATTSFLSATFLVSSLAETWLDGTSAIGALVLQYAWITLAKFTTQLLATMEDVEGVFSHEKKVNSIRQFWPLIVINALKSDVLMLGAFLCLTLPPGTVSVVCTFLVLVASLLLSYSAFMKKVRYPRLPLKYFTSFEGRGNIVIYTLYMIGLVGWYFNSTNNKEAVITNRFSVFILCLDFIAKCYSSEYSKNIATFSLWEEQFTRAERSLLYSSERKDVNVEGFQKLLELCLATIKSSVRVFWISKIVMLGCLFLAFFANPTCTLQFFITSSFVFGVSNVFTTEIVLFIRALNEVILNKKDIIQLIYFR